ncbi:serine/arginine repetitive matrix protein 1 [Panicum miliaceum]|uniref:Serine/arginine repetitive matrix protein 1 n=1 Tax=Panicum miliaceum TaxID=4540 RepID=A0A3L6PYJ9_PANMI|nr:serine/arginine repetitive matrix protein 1 [Panicum miliaceum]
MAALKRLYGLLHKGPANENLDETSRALLMKMLDDATQQTLLKQAKILSGSLMSPALERKLSIRSDRRTRDAEPPMSLRPPALPSTPSLLAGERPSRLNPQYSTVSSRAVGNVHGSPLAAEEPVLARLASYPSSRTTASALPPRHRPSGEQRNSSLSLYRLPVAATSRHGTVTGGARNADHRDTTRRTSGHGDQTSLETSSSRGSERARPGVAATRIRPNRDPKGRRLRRAEDDDEESTPWRRSTNASASIAGLSRRKPRRTLKRVDSGSMYISSHNSLSGAAISYHSTSPTVLPESSASASYSPPPVSRPGTVPPVSWQGIALPMPWRGIAPSVPWRGIAPPMYAPQVSRSMRRRRRQEVLAKRVERLRMLKNKIATVFHHHYHYGRDQEGPSSSRIPGEQHHMSPLKYLGGMLHSTKGQDKKSTSRAVVSAPGKRPGGGGGNMQALFDAMRRHLRAKRRAPTSVNLWRKIANRSRVHAKKMHWWQRLKPRRGRAGVLAGSKLRRRLGR